MPRILSSHVFVINSFSYTVTQEYHNPATNYIPSLHTEAQPTNRYKEAVLKEVNQQQHRLSIPCVQSALLHVLNNTISFHIVSSANPPTHYTLLLYNSYLRRSHWGTDSLADCFFTRRRLKEATNFMACVAGLTLRLGFGIALRFRRTSFDYGLLEYTQTYSPIPARTILSSTTTDDHHPERVW